MQLVVNRIEEFFRRVNWLVRFGAGRVKPIRVNAALFRQVQLAKATGEGRLQGLIGVDDLLLLPLFLIFGVLDCLLLLLNLLCPLFKDMVDR